MQLFHLSGCPVKVHRKRMHEPIASSQPNSRRVHRCITRNASQPRAGRRGAVHSWRSAGTPDPAQHLPSYLVWNVLVFCVSIGGTRKHNKEPATGSSPAANSLDDPGSSRSSTRDSRYDPPTGFTLNPPVLSEFQPPRPPRRRVDCVCQRRGGK